MRWLHAVAAARLLIDEDLHPVPPDRNRWDHAARGAQSDRERSRHDRAGVPECDGLGLGRRLLRPTCQNN